jgi:hypothetical protein
MLFGNQGVYSTLFIAVCQWPMDYSRVLSYGNWEVFEFGDALFPVFCSVFYNIKISLSPPISFLPLALFKTQNVFIESWKTTLLFLRLIAVT